MRYERPTHTIHMNKIQWTLEFVSLILIISYFIRLGLTWKSMPKFMVLDYSFLGNVDLVGSRNYIILLGILCLIIYGALTFFSTKPQYFYYIVNITDENYKKAYSFTRYFLEIIKLEVVVGFVLNEHILMSSIVLGYSNTGIAPHLLIWGMIVLTIGIYVVFMKKKIKN